LQTVFYAFSFLSDSNNYLFLCLKVNAVTFVLQSQA